MSSTRQLAAIMFTDIVGYTALMGNNEQQALKILAINRELQKPIIEKYGGRWIKEIGDGVLTTFSTVSDAVYAAKEIQEQTNKAGKFSLRIGIHLGEIIFEGDDVFGDAVNLASRIQAITPLGGIFVSEAVHNDVANKPDIHATFIKSEKLKNVKEQVRIYQISVDEADLQLQHHTRKLKDPLNRLQRLFRVAAYWLIAFMIIVVGIIIFLNKNNRTGDNTLIQSIAVLPFVNETGDAGHEYLSDGMTETLINSLSKVQQLSVKARSSVFRYKQTQKDARKIGSELSVQALLNGRLKQHGDNIILNLELVDVRNGDLIWGEQYNRKTTDLLVMQTEIARDVTNKLRTKLSGADQLKLSQNYTDNSEAYQLYLRGRFYWNKRTEKDLQLAIRYFQDAILLDPNYALAYSGLADCYNFLGAFGMAVLSPKEAMPEAKAAAMKALEIDEALAEAHASLAFVKLYYDWDQEGSEKEFKRAIELNPNYAQAHQWYSHLLMASGRTAESISAAKHALNLDGLALPTNLNFGWQLYYAGRYNEAIEQLRKTMELDSNFAQGLWGLGLAYEQKKNYAESANVFQRAASVSKNAPVYMAALAHTHAAWGKKDQAKNILKILHEQSQKIYVPPYWIAIIYAALNEKEFAFAWLEKAFIERSGGMVWIQKEPKLAKLRQDPRFGEMLRKVGFPGLLEITNTTTN